MAFYRCVDDAYLKISLSRMSEKLERMDRDSGRFLSIEELQELEPLLKTTLKGVSEYLKHYTPPEGIEKIV